jgi:hypothetical protein
MFARDLCLFMQLERRHHHVHRKSDDHYHRVRSAMAAIGRAGFQETAAGCAAANAVRLRRIATLPSPSLDEIHDDHECDQSED